MKCLDPVLCYTPKYVGPRQFRHFSLASPIFKSIANSVFNCGKCLFCRKKSAFELAVRCVLHSSLSIHNSFLTLTYDEKRDDYHNNLQYSDIQKFKKRLRSYVDYHNQKKIDVFNVHEYGKNGKKHWHLVVFGWSPEDKILHTVSGLYYLYKSDTLANLWPFGFSTVGDVSEASALYTAQYSQKDIKNGNTTNSKRSKSNHSGIGFPYFMLHYKQILELGYIPFAGRKVPIPRAFLRIAHKHYCHFNQPSAFFDTVNRKRLYTPFKTGLENKEISDLYTKFVDVKNEYVKNLEKEWDEMISHHLETGEKPQFVIAAENAIYDFNNKHHKEDII